MPAIHRSVSNYTSAYDCGLPGSNFSASASAVGTMEVMRSHPSLPAEETSLIMVCSEPWEIKKGGHGSSGHGSSGHGGGSGAKGGSSGSSGSGAKGGSSGSSGSGAKGGSSGSSGSGAKGGSSGSSGNGAKGGSGTGSNRHYYYNGHDYRYGYPLRFSGNNHYPGGVILPAAFLGVGAIGAGHLIGGHAYHTYTSSDTLYYSEVPTQCNTLSDSMAMSTRSDGSLSASATSTICASAGEYTDVVTIESSELKDAQYSTLSDVSSESTVVSASVSPTVASLSSTTSKGSSGSSHNSQPLTIKGPHKTLQLTLIGLAALTLSASIL